MSIWHHFVGLLFPDLCVSCNEVLLKGEKLICTACLVNLPVANIGFSNSQLLENRFAGKVNIRAVHSFLKFTKGGNVQNILHSLKYKNRQEVALFMGNLFGDYLKNNNQNIEIDVLIGVPLHPQKLILRGFNQSDLIAKGISEVLNIPFEVAAVIRNFNTATQTKKTRIERYLNVENVFEVVEKDRIFGKKIGLVDDVLTTGATLEVCAQVLLDAGASEITILCLAAAE